MGGNVMTEAAPEMLWSPDGERLTDSSLNRFIERVGLDKSTYDALWQWSVEEPAEFWKHLWDQAGVIAEGSCQPVLERGASMREARWFPNAKLNYAENLLRERPRDSEALVFRAEAKFQTRMTFGELYDQVSELAQALRAAGVGEGDRVAAVLPNCPQAIVAMLATTSIGAVWSSCSPDFGVTAIVDRFGQIEPKVLFVSEGYYYNNKWFSLQEANRELHEQLATLTCVVAANVFDTPTQTEEGGKVVTWSSFTSELTAAPIAFARVPLSHPLFIMYSSGTTSKPKCIVHGHGVLLQHLKEHQLHSDIRPGDRLFYYTTCGWMMWNWLVSALASRAALMLYDGSPFAPGPAVLFDYVDDEKITHFGVSAKYIDACENAGLKPRESHKLESLRVILSTGSVLTPASFDYVYRDVKDDVCLSSISGGTDILSCFALGNVNLPVYKGELQCRGLGMDVAVYDPEGKELVGEKGELVCKSPFPSQPVGFWGDEKDTLYRKAYFSTYPDVWCQGDFVELTSRGTMIFYGRSDAVLNPGGVRIGTAEIYRQVDSMPEVLESLAVGQDWKNDVRVVLFVKLKEGLTLDQDLIKRVKLRIRNNASPRHVPAKVIQVEDIPRTRNGKIAELSVKKVIHGEPIDNKEALANPESLVLYQNLAELQQD